MKLLTGIVFTLCLWLCLGCQAEKKVLYSERVAILPDASGLLLKEIRALEDGRIEMVLLESIGGKNREIFAATFPGSVDVKFRSALSGDTVLLYHTLTGMDTSLPGNPPGAKTYQLRLHQMEKAQWLAAGTEEGSAIFYAPDKWKAYLGMASGK